MCLSPRLIDRDGTKHHFPCGKCEKCKGRRVSGWSLRLMHQDMVSHSSFFITLTYDTNSVPITRNGFMGLDKKHLQLFFKRLRKVHGSKSGIFVILQSRQQLVFDGLPLSQVRKPLKYYAVGEYGGKSHRPHYHIILFNAELELMIGKKDADAVKRGDIPLDGYFPFQCIQWPYGHCTIGQVNGATVGYTMKYISKQKRIPMHRNDDREPEFALMSKRLGKSYLTPEAIQWHKDDLLNRMYITIEGGKKVSMPRYLKDKIYTYQERELIAENYKITMSEELQKEVMENMSKGVEHFTNYVHAKKEALKASYIRMHKKAENGKDKI